MPEQSHTIEELTTSLERRIAKLQKHLPPTKPAPKVEPPFLSKCPICQLVFPRRGLC